VVGWAGDYLPRHLILRVGSGLLIVTVVPIWSFVTAGSEHLVLLLGALGLVFSISSGSWPSIIATLFPTRVRFSGIAFPYNLCVTILAGFAPLTASAMIERTGVLAAPAIYIAACTMLTFISTFAVARLPSRRVS
jgi:MHS family proline/betaine transporter-like MFS transporter